jgi:L-fuculose-phosphate aldolase
VQAIVHAHPPTATGFAAAGIALTEPLVCEVVMGLGCIPLARYGTPGTSELAQTLEPYVPTYDAILMSNHGVVSVRRHARTRLYEDGDGRALCPDRPGHAFARTAAAAERR